jgi:hypothetical protein
LSDLPTWLSDLPAFPAESEAPLELAVPAELDAPLEPLELDAPLDPPELPPWPEPWPPSLASAAKGFTRNMDATMVASAAYLKFFMRFLH